MSSADKNKLELRVCYSGAWSGLWNARSPCGRQRCVCCLQCCESCSWHGGQSVSTVPYWGDDLPVSVRFFFFFFAASLISCQTDLLSLLWHWGTFHSGNYQNTGCSTCRTFWRGNYRRLFPAVMWVGLSCGNHHDAVWLSRWRCDWQRV